jgi:hypothetical protein
MAELQQIHVQFGIAGHAMDELIERLQRIDEAGGFNAPHVFEVLRCSLTRSKEILAQATLEAGGAVSRVCSVQWDDSSSEESVWDEVAEVAKQVRAEEAENRRVAAAQYAAQCSGSGIEWDDASSDEVEEAVEDLMAVPQLSPQEVVTEEYRVAEIIIGHVLRMMA